MQNKNRLYFFAIGFLFIFTVKMSISVAPVIFSLDKKLVNSVIMQLELENETKEGVKDFNKVFTSVKEFSHSFDFSYTLTSVFLDYHYLSKKYLTLYFPAVPTPPPNHA